MSSGKKTTTTTNSSAPPEWSIPYFQNTLGKANQIASQPY